MYRVNWRGRGPGGKKTLLRQEHTQVRGSEGFSSRHRWDLCDSFPLSGPRVCKLQSHAHTALQSSERPGRQEHRKASVTSEIVKVLARASGGKEGHTSVYGKLTSNIVPTPFHPLPHSTLPAAL